MDKLKIILIYILSLHKGFNYPVANSRLTKLVFLSDWLNCLNEHKQISNIHWYYDNYGPYVKDILECVENNSNDFLLQNDSNMFGASKRLISLNIPIENFNNALSEEEKISIKKVTDSTKDLSYQEFINLVYSSYPIKNSSKYTFLNLTDISQKASSF